MKTVKSIISFHPLSVILLVTTGFTIPAVNTVDSPGKPGIFRHGCFDVDALGVLSCAAEFKNTLEPYLVKPTFGIDRYGNSYQNGSTQRGNVNRHCCAITTLRSCIVDKVDTVCGDKAEKTVDSFVDEIVFAVKLIGGKQPCNGKEFYYRKKSPLCWQFLGPLTGVITLTVLLTIGCCSCCICCCLICCRRRRN